MGESFSGPGAILRRDNTTLTNDDKKTQDATSKKVFCLLGDHRVFNFQSPAMFQAGFRAAGIDGAYVSFQVTPEDIGWAVNALRVLHMAGANVTAPYKEAVIDFMDELSEGVQIIGSINTIVIKDNLLKGYNTNVIGIMHALKETGFKAAGKPVLVFGTGGVARSVVFLLKWLNAQPIFVAGRNPTKTENLVKRLGGEALEMEQTAEAAAAANLVINATSVSDTEESPTLARIVEDLPLKACELIFDLNYYGANNMWQALARQKKVRFMDGLAALGHMASHTLSLWTGKKVAPRHFLSAIQAGQGPI